MRHKGTHTKHPSFTEMRGIYKLRNKMGKMPRSLVCEEKKSRSLGIPFDKIDGLFARMGTHSTECGFVRGFQQVRARFIEVLGPFARSYKPFARIQQHSTEAISHSPESVSIRLNAFLLGLFSSFEA